MASEHLTPKCKNMVPTLHPYQEYAKNFVITHPKCGLFLDMGLGKAVDDDTIIPTLSGWKRVGDIQVGEYLFSMTGTPTKVTAVYKHPNKPAFKVTLDDDRSFNCCDEHLIPLHRPGLTTITPVPLKNLMDTYRNDDPTTGDTMYQYAIPWNDPISADIPIENQTDIKWAELGAMLTFCHMEQNKICCNNPESTPEWLITFLDKNAKTGNSNATTQLFQNLMDSTGFISQIPDSFMWMPAQYKGLLLMGMGGLNPSDRNEIAKTKHVEIQVPSQNLAQDIQLLSWSMGHKCESKWRPRKKVAELKLAFSHTADHEAGLKIVDIQPIGNRDMTCFTVDDPTHTYLINDFIVTHNTLVTLMALWQSAPPGHILVIAPKTIAASTWVNEIAKWNIPVRTQSLVVNDRGKDWTRKKRLKLYAEMLDTPPTMYFINREKLVDLIQNLPMREGEAIWPFGTIVVDELQSFKSYSSERTKALLKVAPMSQRFIGLTGTPTPQGLEDLWSEIYFMDNGQRLGKNITAYRNRWFYPKLYIQNHPVNWIPRPGAEDEIYSLINDLVISIKNPNIKLPTVTFNDINVDLNPDELKVYKDFAKESAMILDDGRTVTAQNAGQLRIKLTQMASGTVYTEKGNAESYIVIHEKKLDICEYIINNTSGSVLIAFQFQADRDQLLKRFPQARQFDGTADMIQEWNDRKIPVMILNPASAGHGLNLQYGGHTLIWYTTPTNLEYYLQCNARLARQGQPDPVTIHHILINHTVDHLNLELVQTKQIAEERLIDAVQATDAAGNNTEIQEPTYEERILTGVQAVLDEALS